MNNTIKYSSLFIGVIIFSICAYFMVADAFWLPGDEAIVLNNTGWAHAFIPPREPISSGRFFPLSYSLYNILLLFPHGAQVSITNILMLHVVALLVFAIFIALISLKVLNNFGAIKYPISLFAVLFAVFRIYPEIIGCHTGVWIVLCLLPTFIWCYMKFTEKQKTKYAVIALIIINYIIYCYETVFTIPLAIGASALLFNFKQLTKKERVFNLLLTFSGIIFLVLYAIIVIPNTEVTYDGAHGEDVTLIGNAMKIFIAQKALWVALLFLIIRIVDIIRNKAKFNIFDYLLLSCFAYFCGASVLKLNFVYYYNLAVIVAIPSLLFYSAKYFKPIGTFCLFLVLMSWYGIKMPSTIQKVNKGRIAYRTNMQKISTLIDEGYYAYWYEPSSQIINDDIGFRPWKRNYTSSAIGWLRGDEYFKIKEKEKNCNHSLWFVFEEDEQSFLKQNDAQKMIYTNTDGVRCYLIE